MGPFQWSVWSLQPTFGDFFGFMMIYQGLLVLQCSSYLAYLDITAFVLQNKRDHLQILLANFSLLMSLSISLISMYYLPSTKYGLQNFIDLK